MIVVTGANGFIGSALVWEFNARKVQNLLCVDSVPLAQRGELLAKRSYTGFLSADEFLAYLGSSEAAQKIEAIVHMGACSDTTEMDREFLRRNNTEYTQTLFAWCARHQRPFIYASSGATYGLGEHGFADDIDPEILRPLNPYGDSKVAFDRWAVRQERVPPVWFGLRFFNVYGPNEYHKGAMSSVVYKAFEQVRTQGELKLFRSGRADYEDGKQMRDFVYVKDITRWVWDLLSHTSGSGIYNMGFGQARTWLDLAHSVFQQMSAPLRIHWIDMPPELRDQYQYFTEAKMNRTFGLGLAQPQWSLEAGIQDYLQSYLLQKDRYL